MNFLPFGGGGEEDEEKKQAELQRREDERQMHHAMLEEQREQKRNHTRQKFKLKSKPRISLFAITQNTPSGPSGGGSRHKKPFYQKLLCGLCCR